MQIQLRHHFHHKPRQMLLRQPLLHRWWQQVAILTRSRMNFADRLSCPVILLEDKVVPPSQAEIMIAALRAKRLPFAYIAFPTEGHGFREAANIQRSVEAELYFYSRIFGFTPADPITPVQIENL